MSVTLASSRAIPSTSEWVALVDASIGFTILGRTQARVHGELGVGWARPQERRIVTALLTQPGRPMPRSQLAEWVWPEGKLPDNYDATFHTNMARIRRALSRIDVPARLVPEANTLRIEVDETAVDYHVFRLLLHKARQAQRSRDHQLARQLAQEAVDLFPGEEMLADLDTERAQNWRRLVRQNEWLPATDLLLEQLIATGDLEAALSRLDRLSFDYGEEPALAARRIEVLHRLGRTNDATIFYLNTSRKLRDNGDDNGELHLRHVHDELVYVRPISDKGSASTQTRAASTTHYQLLPDIAGFIGRKMILEKLDRLTITADDRFRPGTFALVGLSGVGKTALAVHWAHRQLGNNRIDKVLCVDLRGDPGATQVEPDEVIDELLNALGFPVDRLTSSTAKATKLTELLHGGRTLVLLDNARNSGHVEPLLGPLSHCIVIVTCRSTPIGLTTRHAVRPFHLQRLHPQDAATLLKHRIGSRAEQQPGVIEQLARVSGGFPLALELIGNHIDMRSGVPLPEFLSELEERLLDIGGTEDGVSRNLQAAFALSHEAIPPEGQQLFRLLGLHPGRRICAHAAAALTGWSIRETRRCIDLLIDAHLLQSASTPDRFRFHDLLRRYATELAAGLDDTARQAAERRMLSFYLHASFQVDRLTFPFDTPVPMLAPEVSITIPDFRSEEDASNWLLHERGNLNAIISWAAKNNYKEYAWRIPHNLYGVYKRNGFYDEIITAYETAITCIQAVGDLDDEAASRNDLGRIYMIVGDHFKAGQQLHLSASIAQQTRNQVGITTSLANLARLATTTSDLDSSLELFQQAIIEADNAGIPGLQASIQHQLAKIHQARGQRTEAISRFQQALWLRRQIPDEHGQAETLTEIGDLLGGLGRYGEAEAMCLEALDIITRIADVEVSSRTFAVLARIYAQQRRFDLAIKCGRQAVQLAQRTRNAADEADALHTLGHAMHDTGYQDAAAEGWHQAKAIYADLGDFPRAQHLETEIAEYINPQPIVPETRTNSTQKSNKPPTNSPIVTPRHDMNFLQIPGRSPGVTEDGHEIH